MKTVAIVLAAGQGSRMKSKCKKQYMLLSGRPILYYSLKVFEDSFIDSIVLVTNNGEESYVHNIVETYGFRKVVAITQGGKERYHSVECGLSVAAKTGKYDFCFIQDSARPFLSQAILDRTLNDVQKYQACVAGMLVKDTIKISDKEGFVDYTPPRDRVWSIQTPQVFSFDLVYTAYQKLLQQEKKLQEQGIRVTDDAMVVEMFSNKKVYLTEGSYDNIKITTPDDLMTAEKIFESIQKRVDTSSGF